MASLHLTPISGTQPRGALARYVASEYALIVGPGGEIPASMYRTSFDTLTLLFTPDLHVLIGFDDYVNLERAPRQVLALPEIGGESLLRGAGSFDEHGIAPGEPGPVHYTLSQDGTLLLVRVSERQAVRRIRCLAGVACGLDDTGRLAEIWIQDLRWEGGE